MKPTLLIVGLLLLGLLSNTTYAQGSLIFRSISPSKGVITPTNLREVIITNQGEQPFSGTIIGSIRRPGTTEDIVKIVSRNVTILPGSQRTGIVDIPWVSRLFYGPGPTANGLAQRGVLEFGDFIICFSAHDAQGRRIQEHCVEKKSVPIQQLTLIYPLDKSTVDVIRPNLVWQSALGLGIGGTKLTYQLTLVEILDGQSPATALRRNTPILLRSGLTSNNLFYPLDAQKLRIDHTYGWEVRVVGQEGEFLRSQQWSFTVDEDKSPLEEAKPGSYAMLGNKPTNRYHVFGDYIQIGLDNNESLTQLDYSIYCLTDNKVIKATLPQFTELHPGLNTIDIPTKDLRLEAGKQYRLSVQTPRKHSYFLQFEIAK